MAKKPDLSTITGEEGYDSKYSLSEFRDYLKVDLLPKNCKYGTVFWRPERYQRSEYELYSGSNSVSSEVEEKIKRGLVAMADSCGWWPGLLVQFWAPKLDGQLHYLTTSDQPFCLSHMSYGPDYYYKGLCQYRKPSMDHQYCVVDEEEGAKEEQLGPVGRVYRNKRPESSPDLRLYSTNEFPLRDRAARCGLRRYVALPIFDNSLNNKCYGVLEILALQDADHKDDTITALCRELQAAELRSTHTDFFRIDSYLDEFMLPAEILEMLESAIKVVPQLHTAQVWVPCKQCADMSNNLTCMERAAFINVEAGEINWYYKDDDMSEYLKACKLHNLQIEKGFARALISSNSKSCFIRNLCDYSISENPLAHYAQKTRLSLYFALCLESVQDCNDLYVIEFFLQSNCREDARGGSFLHLLSRIMEMKLKGFKFASERQLQEELLIESGQPNAIGYGSTEYNLERKHQNSEELNILMVMESYDEGYPESDFTSYLQTADFRCQRTFDEPFTGWGFWSLVRKVLSKNEFSNTTLVPSVIQKKIILIIMYIASKWEDSEKYNFFRLVQFWAPKMEEDRRYLATSDQPCALGLSKGSVLFRKQCMEHHYFVDERVKEEQLGPPGRVFRNGHPEMTPDLCLYSTREFPLRHHAAHCYCRQYAAIPVFEDKSCVGVLEFIGFHNFDFEVIGKALEAANLSSTDTNCKPSLQAIGVPSDEPALKEVKETHELVTQIPHVYMAEVWVPYNECASINSNICCMRRALSTRSREWKNNFPKHRIVQSGKGIAGMVLASENKSCFFRNTCDFSIAEEPLAHYNRRERVDACFAICLQSSYTGNLLYVLEFFLYQGPLNYEYFWPSMSFLLLILEQKLTSFKFASGKKLGEELVVEVIEYSEANKLSFSELNQQDICPFKYKIVPYGQKEHQHSKSQKVQDASDGVDPVRRDAHAMRCDNAAANFNKDDAAKKTDKGKRKTGFYLTREKLEPHFGKRLKDVAEALGVGRSTIKRACRECGIHRWPCYETNKKNPSLFETESEYKIVQDSGPNTCPSTSNNHILLETPLHQNVLQTSTERRQHSTVWPKAQRVIVKAKYEDDIIKFHLGHAAGMNEIVQEVARRLNLKMGSFKLKYLDEDNDKILLACDVDLQDCLKSLTALGKTFLELFVESIDK